MATSRQSRMKYVRSVSQYGAEEYGQVSVAYPCAVGRVMLAAAPPRSTPGDSGEFDRYEACLGLA